MGRPVFRKRATFSEADCANSALVGPAAPPYCRQMNEEYLPLRVALTGFDVMRSFEGSPRQWGTTSVLSAVTLVLALSIGCTTHVVFTPKAFIQRLCALVPRPRAHRVRYHGVFAPAFSLREQVVPEPPVPPPNDEPASPEPPEPQQNPAKAEVAPSAPARNDAKRQVRWIQAEMGIESCLAHHLAERSHPEIAAMVGAGTPPRSVELAPRSTTAVAGWVGPTASGRGAAEDPVVCDAEDP